MLGKSLLSIPYAGGIDQKYAKQLLPKGQQAVISNGTFTKNGSIRKRLGVSSLGAPGGSVARLLNYKRELLAATDDGAGSTALKTYQPDVAGSTWLARSTPITSPASPIDKLPAPLLTRAGISSLTGVLAYDVCCSGNFATYAIMATTIFSGSPVSAIYIVTVDRTTGAATQSYQLSAQSSANFFYPKVFIAGTKIVAVFSDDSGQLWAATSSATAPSGNSFTTPTTLATNMASTSGVFDAQPITGATDFAVVYEWSSTVGGSTAAWVQRWSNALVSVNSTSFGVSSGLNHWTGVGMQATQGENLWFTLVQNSGSSNSIATTVRLDPTTLSSASTVTSFNATALAGTHLVARVAHQRLTATTTCIVISAGPLFPNSVFWQTFQIAAGSITPIGNAGSQSNVYLQSRPFIQGDHVYVVAFLALVFNSVQCSTYLLDLGFASGVSFGAQVAGVLAPTITTSQTIIANPFLSSVVPDTSQTNYTSWLGVLDCNPGGSGRNSAWSMSVDFGRPDRWLGQEYGEELLVAGGAPVVYDGQTTNEASYYYFPEGVTTFTNGAGALNGSYQYVVIYEWYSATGEWHQSAPSVATAPLSTSFNAAQVFLPSYTLKSGNDAYNVTGLVAAIYRTLGGGTTFYRLTSLNVTFAGFSGGAGTSLVYADNTDDATLAGNPVFNYANAVELGNNLLPSQAFFFTHLGHTFACGGDDPKNVWFSKTFVTGFGAGFSNAFIIPFDEPIVGGYSMDGNAIFWSLKSIYVVSGGGPDNAGGGDTFSVPQKVRSDVGCIDARSIVGTQDGVWFLSSGGIYLLTRALETNYLGHNVEDTIDAAIVAGFASGVTSSLTLDSEAHQRWTTAAGTVCVFDDVQKQWSTFSYLGGVGIVSATRWVPNSLTPYILPVCALTDGTTVYAETQGSYLDAGAWVTLSVTSAPMYPANIQGFGRLWNAVFLGEYASPHGLTIALTMDYETAPAQSVTWTDSQITAILGSTREELAVKPGRQKASSYQVTVSDVAPTVGSVGTGQGVSLLSLDLEIGVKKGSAARKMPAGARF